MRRARLLVALALTLPLAGCLTHDVHLSVSNITAEPIWLEFWLNATGSGETVRHENVTLDSARNASSEDRWSTQLPLEGAYRVDARDSRGVNASAIVDIPGKSVIGAVTGWGGYGVAIYVFSGTDRHPEPAIIIERAHAD